MLAGEMTDDFDSIELRPTKELTKSLLNAVGSDRFSSFKHSLEEGLKRGSIDLKNENVKSCLSALLYECCLAPGKPDLVAELLSAGADVNRVNGHAKRAPVHVASMDGCTDVLSVLLGHPGVDVNKLDDDGNSALHLAVGTGNLQCSRLLLDSNGIRPNLTNKKGMTPAYVAATLNENGGNAVRLLMRCPKVNFDTIIVDGKSLKEVIAKNNPQLIPFKYLYSSDESGFISCINSSKRLDGDDGEYTYLQYACNYGLPRAVRALLDLGADPNRTLRTNPKQPVLTASFRGFNCIVRMFLQSKGERVYYQSDVGSVLHEVIIGSNEKHNEVNSKLCNHDRTLKIFLGEGIEKNLFDVNMVDERGNTCLHYAVKIGNIDYIHSLLDSGAYICKTNNLGQTPLDDIGHDTLESYLNKCVKTNGVSPNQDSYEIICSFRFLCPPNVSRYSNDYTETLLESRDMTVENIPETEQLLYISDNPELRPLLMHPVLALFLYQKWIKVKFFYFLYAILYFGFLIFLTSYIKWTFDTDTSGELKYYLGTMVWGFLIVLALCELFKGISSPISFTSSAVNWLQVCLFISTLCLLCENVSKDFRTGLCIIVIQLSFGQFVYILSRHPMLALHWEMFIIVTKNYLSFLVWYSLIIVSFVFCFYVLLRNKNEKNDENKNSFFNVFFEVIIMLTGDIDLTWLKTDLVINKLVVLLFIFFVPVVLVNLLVSLAVSDTHKIKNDAEIIVLLRRIRFIHSIEVRVVRDKHSVVNKHQSNYFICKIISYCTRWFGVKLMMFPDALKKPEVTIFPNKNNAIKFELFDSSSQSSRIIKFQSYHFDDGCVNKAKLIVKLNSEDRGNDTIEKITEVFFNKCIDIENTVKEIREKLNAMNS